MKSLPKLILAIVTTAVILQAAYAAFTATHTISGTPGAAPVTPTTTSFTANPPACTASCNGFLVTGPTACPTATAAVCVTGTSVTGTATFSGVTTFALVPQTTTACSTAPPTGSISLSSTATPIPAAGYQYCLYNTAWSATTPISVTVSYSSP